MMAIVMIQHCNCAELSCKLSLLPIHSICVLGQQPTVLSVFPAVIGGSPMQSLVVTPAYAAHHYFAAADETPTAAQDHIPGPAAMQGKVMGSAAAEFMQCTSV